MKKTLLSFALLLIGVGAWAQTAIDPSKYYTLQCYATDHGGNYIAEVDGEIMGYSLTFSLLKNLINGIFKTAIYKAKAIRNTMINLEKLQS